MKLVKQLLSALLAMLLAFGLFLPAHAEEVEAAAQEVITEEVAAQEIFAQEAPVITITKQPEAFTKTLTNKEITLSVEAKIPEGVEGTLRYQWYQREDGGASTELAGETSAVLHVRPKFDDLGKLKLSESLGEVTTGGGWLYYQVIVTCDYMEDGQEKSVSATSGKAEVLVYPSLLDYFRINWRLGTHFIYVHPEDSMGKFIKWFAAIIMPIIMPFSIIFLPFDYLKFWLI